MNTKIASYQVSALGTAALQNQFHKNTLFLFSPGRHSCDWVICIDMDELIFERAQGEEGWKGLEQFFEKIKNEEDVAIRQVEK